MRDDEWREAVNGAILAVGEIQEPVQRFALTVVEVLGQSELGQVPAGTLIRATEPGDPEQKIYLVPHLNELTPGCVIRMRR